MLNEQIFLIALADSRLYTSGTLQKLIRHVISDNTVAAEMDLKTCLAVYSYIHYLTSRHSVSSART